MPSITPVQTKPSSQAQTYEPVEAGRNTTDVIYQEVRLYVEGVQLPFTSISVNQAAGQMPTAEVEVPPQSGLMDICRFYDPKVHIFYQDKNYGDWRLLFWGHIVGSSYSHSRSGSGSASIRFSAIHKNSLMRQVTLDYSGYLNTSNPTDPNQGAAVTLNALSSMYSIVSAFAGITGVQSDEADLIAASNKNVMAAKETKLMQSHAELLRRFRGMPSVAMNFWNQIKKASFNSGKLNTVMPGMLIPLVEEGLSYFKRFSGHVSLEDLVDEDRQQACLHIGTNEDVIVPPKYRVGIVSALQSKIAAEVANSSAQFSTEMTDFLTMLEQFYYSAGYEMLTLSSPAEVPVDPDVDAPDYSQSSYETMAVETVVKPQLPFYYAPACNVIFPKMFSTVQVGQDERDTPSRVSALHSPLPGSTGSYGSNFRGPHSIREAVAFAATTADVGNTNTSPNLYNTLGMNYCVPGRYEQGRGIRHMRVTMPWWLQVLSQDAGSKADGYDSGKWPDKGTPAYDSITKLSAAWQVRNGFDVTQENGEITVKQNPNKDQLNPYSQKSGVQPYMSVMFTNVDYEFTQAMARSRTGMVDGIFNPYIVPGYPMDILDDTPNHPSFHALCTSVTHSITARSISTTIGMAAVQTYNELSNYYTPPTQPWLQTALRLISTTGAGGEEYGSTEGITVQNAGTLLGNEEGKAAADAYYRSVLGVGAADPSTLIDWTNRGQVIPQARFKGTFAPSTKNPVPTSNGGDANDYNTAVGNLRLVARPVESRASIEDKFDYSFVDLEASLYNDTVVLVRNPMISQENQFLEPGASPFLEYMETTDFVKQVQGLNPGPTTGETSDAVSRRYGVG